MNYLITVKLFSLVFAIWFTEVNFLRAFCSKQDVPYKNLVIQALSITIFLALQFNLFN